MLSPTVLINTLILYNFAKCKVHTKIEKKKCNDQLSINFLSFKNLLGKFEAVCVTAALPEKRNVGESVGVLNLIIVFQTIRLVQQSFEVYTVQRLQIF